MPRLIRTGPTGNVRGPFQLKGALVVLEEILAAKTLPDKPLYHPKEAAELLGVTQTSINTWCREGRLDGFKAGKHWKYVTRESLRVFVEEVSNV